MVIFYVIALIVGGLFAYATINSAYRKTQPEALQKSIIKLLGYPHNLYDQLVLDSG